MAKQIISIIRIILVFIGIVNAAIYASGDGNPEVKITRDLPDILYTPIINTVSLYVDINESNKPNGIVIYEYIPTGWIVTSSNPSSFSVSNGTIKWTLFGLASVIDQNITYTLQILANATGNATFSGEVRYNDKNGNQIIVDIIGDINALIASLNMAVTSNRILPDKANAGSRINISISIDVNESNKPSAVIVKDFFPAGWNIISSAPTANGINSTNREIKWIFTGEQVFDRVVSYIVEIPSNELGNRTFSGEVIYNDPNDNPITVITEGDSIINVEKQCIVKGDFNCDDKVSDFEILDYVSKWIKGEVSDFDLLEAINNWAKG